MTKYIALLFLTLFIYACNTPQEDKANQKLSNQDSLVSLQEIRIASLPDSLQPKTVYLDQMPAAEVTKAGVGEVKMPFIMENGGKSNFTNFTTDNGLALDAVECSFMDKSGNLWFGTQGGGVSRYDGKSFTNFTTAQGLADNFVLSINEDKFGNLWFGSYGGGVSKYDGKSFTNFTTAQGLANKSVRSITEDKSGNLWFGSTGGGISKYDGKSFTNFTTDQGLVNNYVRSITEDKFGNLWIGTDGGASKYDGKSFTSFTTDQGLANNEILSITEDKSGNLWFGTYGGGVSKYDGKSFTTFTTAQSLANNSVRSITEDKSGNLWFGTLGGGVSKYDGKSFTNFTTAQGLANNEVRSITEDKFGNLWFGTGGGGVSKYDGKSFTSFTTAQGLADNLVWSITEDKSGNLWFGTLGSGVSKYDGESFTNLTTAQGLADNRVWSITEDKSGNLWFGTNGGGVSKYDGKSFTSFTTAQGLANNSVPSITEDKSGNLWIGTGGGGVSKYDGKSFTNFTTAQGLANNSVHSITEDKSGNLWFGTYGGGVSRYDGKSFTNFTTDHGLANNSIPSITEDKSGNLWFGTEEGLSLLSNDAREKLEEKTDKVRSKDKISSTIFKSFKIADGLPDNFVTNVIQMPNGKIAVGTNLGITLFNLSNDGTKLTDIEIYNTNTGCPVKDVNVGQNCMLLDSKGIVWAGTGNDKTALVRFDYGALEKNTEPPALIIQSIKVKDENICWYNIQTKGIRKNSEDSLIALFQEFYAYGKVLSSAENDSILKRFGNIQFDGIAKFYPVPENLVLPYEHNQIAFEFAAIETERPFLVRYQYMLEGYDEQWSNVTEKSSANFGNIQEGTYVFKLKARGSNGVWSEPITYTFRVLPPWYRAWWAYLSYVVLVVGLIFFYIRWRERASRARQKELEIKVEEGTMVIRKQKDEVENLLLNILPAEVAEELKVKGSAEAQQFDEVTVLFTDFKGFTQLSEKMSPKELVFVINEYFSAFDHIMVKYGVEKIKTIGDAYMAVGGLPITTSTHATDVISAAIEIQQFMAEQKSRKEAQGELFFDIRIGIHTGPVVAGIVGVKKFAYDIWGDTVNTASRMESNGEVGKINISQTTYTLVKDKFNCVERGKIQVKGKGEVDMYFVDRLISI
jgi:ligand-binding sensor domain-containing protein/class 3 adenylate cyclase